MTAEVGTAVGATTSATVVSEELETRVRVAARTKCADGVIAVDLVDVDGRPLPEWEPGAHIDVVIAGVHERQYSLCGSQRDRSVYRIGVLREVDSRGTSHHIHDTLQVGDELTVRGPRNHFQLHNASEYVFIAGGIGITPILPMVHAAEAAGARWRLVYGGRRRGSMAFLDELGRYNDRVDVRPQDEFGLLDLAEVLGAPRPGTLIYCCGPEPLLAAVEQACSGWPSHSLRVERFAAKVLTEPQRAGSFDVVLERTGRTVSVPADRSILQAVREAGVGVLSSCEEGTCGTCETRVLDGTADHRDSILDEDERADNETMMICVSRSLGPRLVLDL